MREGVEVRGGHFGGNGSAECEGAEVVAEQTAGCAHEIEMKRNGMNEPSRLLSQPPNPPQPSPTSQPR